MLKNLIGYSLIFLVWFASFLAPLPAQAQSNIREFRSGAWNGGLAADENGIPLYCHLNAANGNEFNILLLWNSAGFHIILYNEDWKHAQGEEFQGRVKIDRKFDDLVDANTNSDMSIDYVIGFNTKAKEAFQSGSHISLEGPEGKRSFPLSGTRKAVDVLVNCADEFLVDEVEPENDFTPDFDVAASAFKRGDYVVVLKHILPLAKSGDAEAQNALGNLYYYGRGVPKNYRTAEIWYRRSAEQGQANALHSLGTLYRDGKGVTKDHVEAARWFRRSADLGHVWAQYKVGLLYLKGEIVSKDYAEAIYWFRASAEQGNEEAQNKLGEMYRDGKGVAKNNVEAIRWFRLSAEQGYEPGQQNLAAMLAEEEVEIKVNPESVSASATEADKLIEQSMMILSELEPGTFEQAYDMASQAAELGDRRGQWMAGRMSVAGVGTDANRTFGFARILAAAEAGHPEALTYMGLQYLQGGDPVLKATGMKYLERAAAQNHAHAISALRFFAEEENR